MHSIDIQILDDRLRQQPPAYATAGAAGLDLRACLDAPQVLAPGHTTLVPTGIAIACIALVELPAAWLLSQHFGLRGVWMGYPVAFAAMLLLQATYYRKIWRHQPIRKLV